MTTVAAALAAARTSLSDAGVDSPATDGRLLLAAATGLPQSALLARPGQPVEDAAAQRFRDMVARRAAGEPVARILGEREFWGLPFRLGPATLDPRPDTETLVAAALREARRMPSGEDLRICDLGTGTGAIIIALLHELPEAFGTAVDLSPSAVETARDNAQGLGVAERISFLVGDFAAIPDGPFDLVVSNPPYIETGALPALAREVRDHDPPLALDGGPDGLAAYRTIAARAENLLRPGGALLLEIGFGQGAAVAAICTAGGLDVERLEPDLSGTPRVVVARRRARDTALAR